MTASWRAERSFFRGSQAWKLLLCLNVTTLIRIIEVLIDYGRSIFSLNIGMLCMYVKALALVFEVSLTLKDMAMCHVVKACSLSPHKCVRESPCVTTQAIIPSEVRGGCIPSRIRVSSPYNVHCYESLKLCLCILYRGPQLRSKVRLARDVTCTPSIPAGMHELVPFLTKGLKLASLAVTHHFDQWIILLSYYLIALWFWCLGWHISLIY